MIEKFQTLGLLLMLIIGL